MRRYITTCIDRILVATMLLFVAACSDERDVPSGVDKNWMEYTVAVVLPMESGLEAHWHRTLDMASRNIEGAFLNQDAGIRLNFEWYDEEDSNIEELCMSLASRDDIIAVIGGLYSSDATVMAPIFSKAAKTFFTLATTEELVRAHSTAGYLWAMVETDITQCQMLLSRAHNEGAKRVALLANEDSPYGKTFVDWFGFIADELQLDVVGLHDYDPNDVYSASRFAAASGADFVICVADETSQISEMRQAFIDEELKCGYAPRAIFSDTAYGTDALKDMGDYAEGVEGIGFGADPTSGFDVSYTTFFGCEPTVGEAQVYDAAMMIAYAQWYRYLHPEALLKEALREVVSGRGRTMGSWMCEDIRLNVDAMASGIMPDISGASGSLDFDSKVFTNVLTTVYYGFKVYNGKYLILDYNTSDGSSRTDAALAGWNLKAAQMQEFGNSETIEFAPLCNKKAVLVAASTGWPDYRHQADVLAMYQQLKKNGFNDDDIILVMQDDIADNPKNPEPGVIRVSPGGDNLYEGVEVDYHVKDINAKDILDIISGRQSERLPEVVEGDDGTNIFLFWSGHGVPGGLCWDEEDYGLTADMMYSTLRSMSEEKRFRKLLACIETCFSGSVFDEVVGIPGALFVTAANQFETSKADNYDNDMGIWMSNRFTATLRQQLADNPDCSLSDLYQRLFINTIGSHVMVYGQSHFGSLLSERLSAFCLN